jgi:hypothetical protein
VKGSFSDRIDGTGGLQYILGKFGPIVTTAKFIWSLKYFSAFRRIEVRLSHDCDLPEEKTQHTETNKPSHGAAYLPIVRRLQKEEPPAVGRARCQ